MVLSVRSVTTSHPRPGSRSDTHLSQLEATGAGCTNVPDHIPMCMGEQTGRDLLLPSPRRSANILNPAPPNVRQRGNACVFAMAYASAASRRRVATDARSASTAASSSVAVSPRRKATAASITPASDQRA